MAVPYANTWISGSTLKWLAMATMLCDHVAAVVLMPVYGVAVSFESPAALWTALMAGGLTTLVAVMRLIGRLAFPIFCFLLVEGLVHTRSRAAYLRNLLLAALLSEVPFDLCLRGTVVSLAVQNVLWTLVLGFAACVCFDRLAVSRLPDTVRTLLMLGALGGCMGVAWLAHTDYDAFGVLLIVVLYLLRGQRREQCIVGAVLTAFEFTAPLAFLATYYYNGRRGRQWKWLFYLFYPVHLLVLYGIRLRLIGW